MTDPLGEFLTKDDIEKLENAMTKCSQWLVGHDESPAANIPFIAVCRCH